MRTELTGIRSIIPAAAALVAICGPVAGVESDSGRPAASEVVTTNWVERALTNVIEVQIPKLIIVDEFRTNTTVSFATNIVEVARTQWVDRFETNVINSLSTNWVTVTQTNTVVLDQYRTNRIDVVTTNFLTVFATNFLKLTLTNTVVLDQVQTNLFFAYQTNHTTLSVTNWDTVLVMNTNWISQPVTNVVEIAMPSPRSTALPPTSSSQATQDAAVQNAPATDTDGLKNLVLEWARESKNPTEIVLTLKAVNEAELPVQVQEWRVERSDAAILLMGRDPEFRAELPAGTYNVTVKARRGETGPALTLHGSIKVTPDAETHQALVATAN